MFSHVVYGLENVHENHKELHALDVEVKKGRIFNIQDHAQFENFLNNSDYMVMIYYYFDEAMFTESILDRLTSLPYALS
jgi:hypothetical protein